LIPVHLERLEREDLLNKIYSLNPELKRRVIIYMPHKAESNPGN